MINEYNPDFSHLIIVDEVSMIDNRLMDSLLRGLTNNIKLVIAPDSSSNDYEEHKILKERGIDVLVIDHHEAD